MNRPLLALLTVVSFLSSGSILADQTPRKDTSAATHATSANATSASASDAPIPSTAAVPPDDDFNLFLLFLATAFVSVILGAVIVGSFAATLFLFFLFALVSAGILTASVLTGLYKRSFSAGFKTLSIIVCSLGGIVAGSLAMLVANGLFKLNLSHPASIAWGVASGLIGGVLLGLSISTLFRRLTDYFRKKLPTAA